MTTDTPKASGEQRPGRNTNRELWREREGDFYANSIHVTKEGAICLNVGGHVICKPVEKWHSLATPPAVDAVEAVAPVDIFEMGYAFASSLRGQTMEDSRAVGRLLWMDIFSPLHARFDGLIKESGFDSFKDAESGVVQCKQIIHAALAPLPQAQGGDRDAVAFDIETKFWSIVDRDGLSGLPSDMWAALELLSLRYRDPVGEKQREMAFNAGLDFALNEIERASAYPVARKIAAAIRARKATAGERS